MIDMVLGEHLRILPEIQTFEPFLDVAPHFSPHWDMSDHNSLVGLTSAI
jgi:hypothetical protein